MLELLGKNRAIEESYPTRDGHYLGTIHSNNFIGGNELSNSLGMGNVGSSGANSFNWHRFERYGKRLFVPQLPPRIGVTWAEVYSKGLVYGVDNVGADPVGTPVNQKKVIRISGTDYLCRMLTAADQNPTIRGNGALSYLGGECLDLLIPLFNGQWASFDPLSWELGQTNNRHRFQCQETTSDYSGRRTDFGWNFSNSIINANPTTANMQWRPVLEQL